MLQIDTNVRVNDQCNYDEFIGCIGAIVEIVDDNYRVRFRSGRQFWFSGDELEVLPGSSCLQ